MGVDHRKELRFRIEAARAQAGWTQGELAGKLWAAGWRKDVVGNDCVMQTVQAIESGVRKDLKHEEMLILNEVLFAGNTDWLVVGFGRNRHEILRGARAAATAKAQPGLPPGDRGRARRRRSWGTDAG